MEPTQAKGINKGPVTRSSGAKAQKRHEIANRRRRANELFLSGWSQMEVAEKIGVDNSTISTDLKALREEWRRENLATTAQHIDRELTSLAMDERDARDGLAASSEQKDRAKWHEIILKIRDRRAKLLGLDAPTRIEQKVEAKVVEAPLAVEKDPELERLVRETAARAFGPRIAPLIEGSVVVDGNGAGSHN